MASWFCLFMLPPSLCSCAYGLAQQKSCFWAKNMCNIMFQIIIDPGLPMERT